MIFPKESPRHKAMRRQGLFATLALWQMYTTGLRGAMIPLIGEMYLPTPTSQPLALSAEAGRK